MLQNCHGTGVSQLYIASSLADWVDYLNVTLPNFVKTSLQFAMTLNKKNVK